MKIRGKKAEAIIPTLWELGGKFYIIREVNGRKRQLYLRGITMQQSAMQMAAECDIAVVNNTFEAFAGKFQARKSMSVAQAFSLWIQASEEVNKNKAKVIATKKRLAANFLAQVSSSHLSAIDRSAVEKYVSSRNVQVSPTTAGDELTKMRTFFRFCVSKGWISSNPAEGIQGPKKSARTKDYVHVITRSELDRLSFRRPVYRNICLALWHTGLRIEELYRVRLQDIHESILHVRCDEERTKNARGREVEISPEAREALRKVSLSDLPHTETVRKVLKRACKRAGLSSFTPHQFRHSRASLWLAQGLPKKNISALLGHSSTDVTESYLHPVAKETYEPITRTQ